MKIFLHILITIGVLIIVNAVAALLLGFHFVDLAVIVGITAVILLLIFNFSNEGSGSNVDPQTLSFVATPKGSVNSLDKYTIISLLVAISYLIVSVLFLLF